MQTYLQCPLAYKFSYIDKLPFAPSPAMMKGVELHRMFERFFSVLNKGSVPKEKFLKMAEDKPDYLLHLTNFLAFNERILDKAGKKYFKPLYTEKHYTDQKLKLTGIIDVAYQDKDGVLLIDYKTGKYNSAYKTEGRFGLAVYKHLHDEFNEKKVTHWGEYYSAVDAFWIEKYKPSSMLMMHKRIEKCRKGIEGEKFDATPNYLCDWCNYADRCNCMR